MRTQRTIDKMFEESDMDTNSIGILAALSRVKTTIPLTTTPLPTFIGASSSAPTPTTKGETAVEIGSSPNRFSSGGILPIAVETLLPSPPPLQQMGPVEITANLNSTTNSGTTSSSSSSSSSDQLSSSSDSSYSLSSSYADDHAAGLDKLMLTSELNNAHASSTDSVVKSEHSYFKVLDPPANTDEDGEQSKRKKGRPRKYNVVSPSTSKTQTKLSHFTSNKSTAKSDSTSVSKSKPINRTPTRNPPGKYVRRNTNCMACENCLKLDCGKCRNCLDKPKFGGRNTKKQRCIERICLRRGSYDGKQREAGSSPSIAAPSIAAPSKVASSIAAPSKATPSKSSLTYSARKRSLSQIATTLSDKTTSQPKPIKTPKLSVTPTKLSTSTTVVSSANSKVTMATSEKKEYATRTSVRRESSVPKVEEETELQFLLSTAPRSLRNQLAINMALPTKSAKDSPHKGSSPAPEDTPTRKSLRSSTLAATVKSINKANNATTTTASSANNATTTASSANTATTTASSANNATTTASSANTATTTASSANNATTTASSANNATTTASSANNATTTASSANNATTTASSANNATTIASSVVPSSMAATTVTTTTKSPSTKDKSPKPTTADPLPKASTRQNKEQADSNNTAQVSSELAVNLPSNLPPDSEIIVIPSLQDGVPMEQWTIANVAKFLTEIKYQQYITIFQHQEIDGQALVLLEVRDMVQTLNMKLGPALKLHRIVGLLKQK